MAEYKFVDAEQLETDLGKVGAAIRTKGGTTELLSFPEGMVSAIDAISTGVELNFDVVPGLTQPGTAAENTIWVKTESLTGWYFSATQPENMAEGEVWFLTGTESAAEFNALKKNAVQVYPLSAKQMVDGALVYVAVMSYQGGEWTAWWYGELFDKGNQYANITGGWERKNGLYITTNTGKGESIVGDTLYINAVGVQTSVLTTVDKIDLTNFKTVKINVTDITAATSLMSYLLVHDNEAGELLSTNAAVKNISSVGVHDLDISAIPAGKYYISFACNSNRSATADKVWVER